MALKIDGPVACIDLESTGVDPVKDEIIDFAAVVLSPDGSRTQWQCRVKPSIPIPAEATAIHGITNADVADCPPFSHFARKIWLGLKGKDIAGYNLRSLDLPLLDEEMRRCGLKLDISGVRLLDAFGIFAKKEARSLADAVKKYCGRDHAAAHGALADADATVDVLLGQIEAYPDLAEMSLDDLAKFSQMGDFEWADLARKLYRDADGDLRYGFSKVKDVKVRDDPGFGYWMLGKDFCGSTCDALHAEFERLEKERVGSAEETLGSILSDALAKAGL